MGVLDRRTAPPSTRRYSASSKSDRRSDVQGSQAEDREKNMLDKGMECTMYHSNGRVVIDRPACPSGPPFCASSTTHQSGILINSLSVHHRQLVHPSIPEPHAACFWGVTVPPLLRCLAADAAPFILHRGPRAATCSRRGQSRPQTLACWNDSPVTGVDVQFALTGVTQSLPTWVPRGSGRYLGTTRGPRPVMPQSGRVVAR